MNTSNKVKFLTTSDRQGEVILKYLNKTCQQALDYCQNNNLQSYEDFAQTIKVIGDRNAESKGEHLAIRVGVKENDLVLSLANRPQLGTTKSIKMLEHLGNEEKYQFTRSTVEGLLQKKPVKTIDRQLIDIDPDITTEPIVIDRSGDFFQQLEQINAALERLEQKLDSLEERIKHLEQLLDKQSEEKRDDVELDSSDDLDSDVWDEDESSQSDKEAEELDTRLVNVLLDVSEKYEQINPNSESGIPIGDSCRLCSDRADERTIITIEERDEEEVTKIFKATINKDEFVIDKDELNEDEKQAIVESFSQKLEEIDDFLDKQQQQNQSKPNQSKKQKEIAI